MSEAREPKWWEWVEENWADLVAWVKAHIDPTKPNPPGPPPAPPTPTPLPPTSGTIAWVNTDSAVSDADVETWVDGLNAQVPQIQQLWPTVQEWTHIFVPSRTSVPAHAVVATLKPELPEAPGALGYHDYQNGKPLIMVGTQTCIQAGVSVSSCMSHEAGEVTVDPTCSATATAPNGDVWALEVGDPVESDSYDVKTPSGASVQMSDLVGQAFFGMGSGARDLTGNATAPFTIAPGGYAVINNTAVYGEHFPDARKRNVEALGHKGTPRRPVG